MASKNTNPSSAVSNAVNDLIRAAIGGEARTIGDEDLDKYVADLILKESEAKRKKYDTVGVSAYLPNTPPSNLPKPNKRFLLNVVKATDSHNQALREQEEQRSRYQQQRKRYSDNVDDRRQRQRRDNRHDDNDPLSEHDHDTIRRQQQQRNSPSRRDHTSHDVAKDKPRQQKTTKDDQLSSPAIMVRGRGAVKHDTSSRGTMLSKMDKYFDKRYDPLMDIEPDLNQMIYTEFPEEEEEVAVLSSSKKEKKKRKKEKSSKKKKSNKKRKRSDSYDDEDASSGSERRHRSSHHHRKKKKRRNDEKDDYSSISESSSEEVWVEEPKPVRAWDVGKQSSS